MMTDAIKRQTERLMKELKSYVESTEDKSDEMKDLKNEASETEKEISKVGEAMLMMMDTLQKKADDIENIVETSLDRQKQLFDSHIAALNVLESLSRFQSQVLEESRGILQHLIEVGHSQQKELIQRQQELRQAHGYLVEHSKSISAAKRGFGVEGDVNLRHSRKSSSVFADRMSPDLKSNKKRIKKE
ncbi:hypothetical protein L1887_32793 [Cichorium endivia]|nr:hypothetical protein L1887_32793 [Cichorium endivia]